MTRRHDDPPRDPAHGPTHEIGQRPPDDPPQDGSPPDGSPQHGRPASDRFPRARLPHDPPRSDLAALQRRLAAFAATREWQPFHTPKNLAAALSVEAAELLEIFQWLTPEQSAAVMDDPDSAHRVRDEVADVLAYLLQFCDVLGIDLLTALAEKIDRNEHRFPRPGAGPIPSSG